MRRLGRNQRGISDSVMTWGVFFIGAGVFLWLGMKHAGKLPELGRLFGKTKSAIQIGELEGKAEFEKLKKSLKLETKP